MDLAVEAHQSMYDNALMGILQNCGKLQPFLDAIFCFLARRTDFYILMKHERAKMGFPPGVAEGMVQQAFKKYEILTRKREAEIMREEETQKVEKMSLEVLPPKSAKKPDSTRGANEDELPIVIPEDPSQGGEGGGGGGQSTESTTPPKKAPAAGTKEKKKSAKKVSKGQKDRTTAFNYTSDVFNGGDMDAYKWSQTITEVEIKVVLPENTTGKHVRVDIRSDYLKIEILKPEHKVYVYIRACTIVAQSRHCIFR
jgi:hypothetical protein